MVYESNSDQEGPGKQYPYEKTGGLEPGRFKPIAEPGAVEKDPAVFTGLEKAWVTVDKVGIPTLNPGRFAPITCSPRKVSRFAPLNRYYIIIDEVFLDNFLVIIYLLVVCKKK